MSARVPTPRYIYDESRWPLLRVTCPSVRLDPASFERHIAYLDGVLARRSAYVLLIDTRGAATLDARARDRIRQQRMASQTLIETYQRGLAIVVDSPLQKAIMSSIMAVAPGPSPERIFTSMDEAEAWASALLAPATAAVGA